jgi:hypothetical protein
MVVRVFNVSNCMKICPAHFRYQQNKSLQSTAISELAILDYLTFWCQRNVKQLSAHLQKRSHS